MSDEKRAAAAGDYVVSPSYEGQNRRRRKPLFSRDRRLEDAAVDKEHGEGSSVDTLLRRLRVWQNLNKAPRSDRAEYMVLLEHLAERGRAGAAAWLPIAEGALTYVRARGAAFPLDEHLLSEAMFLADVLHADEGSDAGKARVMAARLVAAARTP